MKKTSVHHVNSFNSSQPQNNGFDGKGVGL